MKVFAQEKETPTCPSCGKIVPQGDTCPSCGAVLGAKGRISLKRVHLAFLLLGIIGIAMVAYAYYDATHIIPINSITPDMNGRTVLISGVVIDAAYDERYEKTTYTVNDSTGSIAVFGWSDFTSALRLSPEQPSIGDRILVEGLVDVYNNVASLEVKSLASYQVLYVSAEAKEIGTILVGDVGKKIIINGNVTEKFVSYSGTTVNFISLTIKHLTTASTIDVLVSGDLLALAGLNAAVLPNATQLVEVVGMVTLYGGQVEILPSNATSAAIRITG